MSMAFEGAPPLEHARASRAVVSDAHLELEAFAPDNDRLVSLRRTTSIAAEQYRMLRHLIEQARRTTDVTVIGVSIAPGAIAFTRTPLRP